MKEKELRKILQNKKEKALSTQSHKKLWNYYIEITKSEHFLKTVSKIRNQNQIPEQGFPTPDRNHKLLELNPKNRFFITPFWKHADQPEKNLNNIQKEIKKLCKKYNLHYMDWVEVMLNYIFYSEKNIIQLTNSFNLCLVSDLVFEKKESFGREFKESDDMAFPIAVRISPYASLRDIKDYIDKMYTSEIKPLQEHHKNTEIKIGKFKTKNEKIQERNDFIYQNKDLPLKKLRTEISNKFGYDGILDDGHITKIISLEKKRREL